MKFSIRMATANDMQRVHELITELAVFEKEPEAVEITVEDLVEDGFGKQPKFQCFVAEDATTILGIALFYPRYSTWKGSAIHLEDLIVTENARGKGIGKALLDEIVKLGHQKGVRRICWDVLDWNEPAITFYENNGANVLRDWDVVHLNEQGIQNYINNI